MAASDWKTVSESIDRQDVCALGFTLLQLLRSDLDLHKQAWEELMKVEQQSWIQWITMKDKYKSKDEAFQILIGLYKPNLDEEGAKNFWDFVASAVCGPNARIYLEEFSNGLENLKIPEFK